jgi:hypothetical protein
MADSFVLDGLDDQIEKYELEKKRYLTQIMHLNHRKKKIIDEYTIMPDVLITTNETIGGTLLCNQNLSSFYKIATSKCHLQEK